MVVNPEISILNPQRVVRRHRRFTVSAAGKVTVRGFEVPKMRSFLLRPDQIPEQNWENISSTPTNIAGSATYPEFAFNAVNRIELCD